MDHSIVFSGRLRDGSSLEEVRANLGRLFRLEPGPRLDALFSGRPVTIKKGLSEDEARRYADTLLRAGAHCEVVGPRPAPAPAAPRPAAPAAATAPPAPAAGAGGLSGLALMPIETPARAEPEAAPEPAPAPRAGATPTPAAATTASLYAVGAAARRREPLVDSNNSGGGANSYVPEEVRGLAWGAFLLNWIWGLGNSTFIALLSLVPIIGFFVPFYLLFKGRELAWRNRRWDSIEHFNRVQKRWGLAGLAFMVLFVWWSISVTNKAMERVRQDAEERAAEARAAEVREAQGRNAEGHATPGQVQLDPRLERELEQVQDPVAREKMRSFYQEVERARAAQGR